MTGDFVTTGGMDRANHALASYLARNGSTVELVAHRVAADVATLPNVSLRAVSKPLGSYLLGRWPLAWLGAKAGQSRLHSGGRVVVNGGNCSVPDVNWVHYVHAAYRPDTPSTWSRRLKARFERPWDLRAERAAIRTARIVVCNSDRTRRDVIEHLGVHPDSAVTIYYGSNSDHFRLATTSERTSLRLALGWPLDRPVVVFIGALGDRRKGFDTLFEAWRRLCNSGGWDALLIVVGHGAELPQWRRRATDANLAEQIWFLGFRADVPDLLRAADALASPTRYEAYGLGVQEALCCGLPAIVSADAGVAERYPSELEDLLLVNPESVSELADRLRHWRANCEDFAVRVHALSDQLRAYSWDDMARDFLVKVA